MSGQELQHYRDGTSNIWSAKRPRIQVGLLSYSLAMSADMEIDDSLYSRQRYVLGDSAMQRMARSSVLLHGLGGLGVEVAKNIVLAGVKSLTVQDPKVATTEDLGCQFFLREDDVKKGISRAEASASRLAELNPYVTVKTMTAPLDDDTDLDYLMQYQCIILTEIPLSLQMKINAFCRSQTPQIKFISTDAYGVFSWGFCDFGDEFEIIDTNGEEPKEVFVSNISKDNPGVVTTIDNRFHGLEDGDYVTFKEVEGMSAVNGKTYKATVLTPYTFSICDTSGDEFGVYKCGGIISQVKVPKIANYQSLEAQLKKPSILIADLCKFEAPDNIHLGIVTLDKFRKEYARLPHIQCDKDAAIMVEIAKVMKVDLGLDAVTIDERLIKNLSYSCRGCLAPLCAAFGGIMAQECLKALTGKFTPLNQWLCLEASEVMCEDTDLSTFQPVGNRYDGLRICVGEDLCKKLTDIHLFMVGCGAIGCEMLKNYALLGISTSSSGLITITDNDLIEKSNLNRQFLFRPHHIRQPKSTTAAKAVCEINPDLKIEAQQHKVCPQTEADIYHDAFFDSQNIVVNALDNVEARRYVDSRCVTSQVALLESGTMGAKGHVQVIVPHLTESYSSQRDPVDEDVPYCTLKSFPAIIEHCIQWARDKFESSFVQKPSLFNKFWGVNKPQEAAEKLLKGMPLEGSHQVSKIIASRPKTWDECVKLARLKFEKYFNHKACHLLHAFPLDTLLKDGQPFWSLPKRPPMPLKFDADDSMHMAFIISTAHLLADICGIKYTEKDTAGDHIKDILTSCVVPEFQPVNKKIVTDENEKKPEEAPVDDLEESAMKFNNAIKDPDSRLIFSQMIPLDFEKDDDENGHIDFITSAANLRASMYNIEHADRLKAKRIAGHIVPAIATTTAAVSGLVTIELMKVIKKVRLEDYKNTFLNLAIPVILFSEPGAIAKTKLKCGLSYTMWDRLEVQGNKNMTLAQFLQYFKDKYDVEVAMIVHGVKMIYVPIMPLHKKRLPNLMTKLIRQTEKKYADLVVSFTGDEDDEMGPPVRYFFNA